jgi:hypothetical protein
MAWKGRRGQGDQRAVSGELQEADAVAGTLGQDDQPPADQH